MDDTYLTRARARARLLALYFIGFFGVSFFPLWGVSWAINTFGHVSTSEASWIGAVNVFALMIAICNTLALIVALIVWISNAPEPD